MVIPGTIERDVFIKRFCKILEKTYDDYFVECDIEIITDLKEFKNKVLNLDSIYKISAKIWPPNPLFGPLWKHLVEYLKKRSLKNMSISEDAPTGMSINTSIPEIINHILGDNNDEPTIPDITDAALLMATDGYGNGFIKGKRNERTVTIKTNDNAVNFMFEKEPDPHLLYHTVIELAAMMEEERRLMHDEEHR